ncbi:MAG: chemotaxis protein CheR [Desulfobulbaceae bacterium A2]|nr:MAG: chemotaxis protein CheR [Desulfobulbaceae bacterium A2]
MLKIGPDEFQQLSQYILQVCGIALDSSKTYLVETRLGTLAAELGCPSFFDLVRRAKADISHGIEQKIIDAISTNETLFFRDNGPFQLLQHKVLPEIIDARNSRAGAMKIPIRIWSAACSTGQELYSIAMVLRELLPDLNRYNVRLLGTDISNAAVSQASSGRYNKFEMERGLPREKLDKYFRSAGSFWQVRDELRAMANFQRINLMQSFTALGKFDIIFCRNVAIYFSLEDRKKLFDRLANALEPDGSLIIGSTESLTGICPRFLPKRHLQSIFYQMR